MMNKVNRIPKIIHYCWFGGNPMTELGKRCIDSWKKYCPGYEIREWNESNFDIHCCRFVEEAYEGKKWAFVADYARFYAIYNYGGVYLETDSKIIKPIDNLLSHNAFFGFGSETMTLPLIGSIKGGSVAKKMLDYYESHSFIQGEKQKLMTVNEILFNILIKEYRLVPNNKFQVLKDDTAVYPKEFFFSTDWQTGVITKNPQLYVIHYADGSWLSESEKFEVKLSRKFTKIIGAKNGKRLGKMICMIKYEGWTAFSIQLHDYILRKTTPYFMKVWYSIGFKNNKIVFCNFAGRGYGDNPKYIAEEILRRGLSYDLVWLINSKGNYKFPRGIRTVNINSFKALRELATASVWVDNNRKTQRIVKGKRQFYIQTWHGLFPLKKIEKDAINSLDKEYIKDAMHDSEMVDLMVSGCEARTKLYKESFWYNGEVIDCGTPRNDIFFKDGNSKEKIHSKFYIPSNGKLVLYAPTFRDNHDVSCYNIEFEKILAALQERYNGSWYALIRLHPAVREKSKDLIQYNKHIIDVSDYDDIQELFVGCDVLISDYSDCIFEFSIAKKPVFLYTPDLAEYTKGRSFYYEITNLPFSISFTNTELLKNIREYDEDDYLKLIEKFHTDIKLYERGEASKTVVDYIQKFIERA